MFNSNEWIEQGSSTDANKVAKKSHESITLRAEERSTFIPSIKIALGLGLCNRLGLKLGDHVKVFLNKSKDTFLVIKERGAENGGKKLSGSQYANYLHFSFAAPAFSLNELKIKKTVLAEFSLNKDGSILIKVDNLKINSTTNNFNNFMPAY